jgi:PilZ domain
MSDDKRRDPRFDAKHKLWCEGQGERAETRNISRSGMFVLSEQPREVGEQFKVAFEGEEGAIELNMEVMWRGESGEGGQAAMGLRIVGFDRGEDAYERFVERNLDAQGSEPASASENSEKSDKSEK